MRFFRSEEQRATRAVVVFHGHGLRLWRRILKSGFHHCFAAVDDGSYWILFDPKSGRPELRVLAGSDFALVTFYRQCGYIAVEATIEEGAFVLPVMPATCVAVVKRLIGLRAPLVLTPWQLYRHLTGSDWTAADGKPFGIDTDTREI